MSAQIDKNIGKLVKELIHGLERVNKETPSVVLEISKYGWYFFNYESLLPREPFELKELIDEGRIDELDNFFLNYFYKNSNEIKIKLVDRHKPRKIIFEEIFKAHENKLFFSSICLALTQVDGICHDEFSDLFFANDERFLPKVLKHLEKEKGFMAHLFLSPIENKTAINSQEKKKDNFPVNLNRHSILHGKDLRYATEINSLKIISFLSFISDLIENNKTRKLKFKNGRI